MIFSADIDGVPSCQLVLDGKKTQTWRRAKDGDGVTYSFAAHPGWHGIDAVQRLDKHGELRLKWKVGQVLSVQPGRGKKGVGHIRITEIIERFPAQLSLGDLEAEGLGGVGLGPMFFSILQGLYPDVKRYDIPVMPGYSLVFELVKGEKDD